MGDKTPKNLCLDYVLRPRCLCGELLSQKDVAQHKKRCKIIETLEVHRRTTGEKLTVEQIIDTFQSPEQEIQMGVCHIVLEPYTLMPFCRWCKCFISFSTRTFPAMCVNHLVTRGARPMVADTRAFSLYTLATRLKFFGGITIAATNCKPIPKYKIPYVRNDGTVKCKVCNGHSMAVERLQHDVTCVLYTLSGETAADKQVEVTWMGKRNQHNLTSLKALDAFRQYHFGYVCVCNPFVQSAPCMKHPFRIGIGDENCMHVDTAIMRSKYSCFKPSVVTCAGIDVNSINGKDWVCQKCRELIIYNSTHFLADHFRKHGHDIESPLLSAVELTHFFTNSEIS